LDGFKKNVVKTIDSQGYPKKIVCKFKENAKIFLLPWLIPHKTTPYRICLETTDHKTQCLDRKDLFGHTSDIDILNSCLTDNFFFVIFNLQSNQKWALIVS
jgi:hypothetical protein